LVFAAVTYIGNNASIKCSRNVVAPHQNLHSKGFHWQHIPDYIILSHTWGSDEVLFEDAKSGSLLDNSLANNKAGFIKVKGTCNEARRNGYDWVWIDSLCINKTSSAELQEAINSMWNWYRLANVCYVFLEDTEHRDLVPERDDTIRWFSRGWTLQELLAPPMVQFYNKRWTFMGTKISLLEQLEAITGINKTSLVQGDMRHHNGAEKMSWVAHREVTREEDMAYSLLGLFGVNMPLLYGEGRYKAFARLQEQIMQNDVDHTLFLYRYRPAQENPDFADLIAHYPSQFCQRQDCELHTDIGEVAGMLPPTLLYSSLVLGDQPFNTISGAFSQTKTAITTSFKVTSPVTLDNSGNVINEGFGNTSEQIIPKPDILSHAKNLGKRLIVIHLRVWYGFSQLCLLLLDKSGSSNTFRRLHSDLIQWTGKSSISDKIQMVYILQNSTLVKSSRIKVSVSILLGDNSWNIVNSQHDDVSPPSEFPEDTSNFTFSTSSRRPRFAISIRNDDRYGSKFIFFDFVLNESGIGTCTMRAEHDDKKWWYWSFEHVYRGHWDGKGFSDYLELLPESGVDTKTLTFCLLRLPRARRDDGVQEFSYRLDIREKELDSQLF
jgi:hypothetical protein